MQSRQHWLKFRVIGTLKFHPLLITIILSCYNYEYTKEVEGPEFLNLNKVA